MTQTESTGWNFQCNVLGIEIDVLQRRGSLFLAKNNVPSMRSTINNFLSADPEIREIYTHVDGVLDIVYYFDGNEWQAGYPKGTARSQETPDAL